MEVDEFLDKDLECSPEGLPLSPLWKGTRADPDALNSLRMIRNSRQDLTQLNNKLDQLLTIHNQFTQELSMSKYRPN
ncbi:hypothetical protein ACHAPQ_011924 [Fusarium lateritium]